ncbi:HNH endonuclease [Microbulbifer sp. Q7]|uniref:HNH endonuclease n=1 Tax=Microbulbifer sp. Q7 TaxID=1785091 RepID=UPI00082BA50C|nr:HNH endonuclease [Microbulbifer sp. Q7]
MDYWLLLEKSDETRVSKGIRSYEDTTGRQYNYDSLVPNHRNLKQHDRVVLRKENDILGYGVVGSVRSYSSVKEHSRCVSCDSTDVRERSTKLPRWKCGRCGEEFKVPKITSQPVKSFEAIIGNFIRLEDRVPVRDVKACAASPNGQNSQHSILKLDQEKIQELIDFSRLEAEVVRLDDLITKAELEIQSSLHGSAAERKARLKNAKKKPDKRRCFVDVFVRNPDVVAEVLSRANGTCENCGNEAPFIRRSNGEPYLEVHHKIRLADDGEDSVENAIALCPNCHRMAHYG